MKNLNDDPKFISGIHNYCDHWCERCPFTTHCLNFALNNKDIDDQISRDRNNQTFWTKLSKTFLQTQGLLDHTSKQQKNNFASINSNKILANKRISDEFVRAHVCCRMAESYAEMVDNWFDLAEDISEQIKKQADVKPSFELPQLASIKGPGLEDALQIIRWYQNQIYIKLMRAVRSGLEEAPKISDDFARNSDGTAKVALIAIDRSIAAWGETKKHYPQNEDKIMEILLQLAELCKKIEAAFPDARAFIRPGFDKIDLNG